MLIDNINLYYETELLESLDWDEDKLKEFYKYLSSSIGQDELIHPNKILEEVKSLFSESTSNILKKIFLQIAVSNNMHAIKGDTYDN